MLVEEGISLNHQQQCDCRAWRTCQAGLTTAQHVATTGVTSLLTRDARADESAAAQNERVDHDANQQAQPDGQTAAQNNVQDERKDDVADTGQEARDEGRLALQVDDAEKNAESHAGKDRLNQQRQPGAQGGRSEEHDGQEHADDEHGGRGAGGAAGEES